MSISGRRLTYADNPTVRQGAMDAAVDYDGQNRNAIIQAGRRGRGSLYMGADKADVWDIQEREIAFIVLTGRPQPRTAVLSALNGQAVEATAQYAGRPDEQELVQLAVRNSIQPLGVNVETVRAAEGMSQAGGALALAGLNTLSQAADVTEFIRAGDLVEALVPLPKNNARLNAANHNGTDPGVPKEKYRLECGPVNPASAGRRLRLVIREIVTDPAAWTAAMGPTLRGTRIWQSAARNVIDSYLTAIVLGVGVLAEAGHVTPAGGLAAFMQAEAAGNATVGERAAVTLAQALGIVQSGRVRGRLTAVQRGAVQQLRHELVATVFYDAVNGKTNKRFEFAYRRDRQGQQQPGRAADGALLRHDPFGDLVTQQLNHFPRAVGAFHDAILDQQRFILGKATTSVGQDESKKFNIALGVCKP